MIEAAVAAGVNRSHQVLQLTHGDSSKLKRDPSVRNDEISFENGTMVFIGVRVIEGASRSVLGDINGIDVPPNPADAPLTAAKGKKKAAKVVRKPKAEKTAAAAAESP
jgi:hypothetical protein